MSFGMALDFSDYLLSASDHSKCFADWSSTSHEVSNTRNGCHMDEWACAKLRGGHPNGIWKGKGESSSRHRSSVPEIVGDDYDDDVFKKVSSKNSPVDMTLQNGSVKLARHTLAWQTGSHETLSWNGKLNRLSKNQLHLEDVGRASCSIEDLRKILQRLKTTMTCPSGLNDMNSGVDPDGQNPDRPTLRQLAYRCRRSLPDRLTDDHVTPAKHDARKKFSRRGSVKFADEFGLNLNTFAMIPSRYNAQAHNVVKPRLPQDNWMLNTDDGMRNSDDRKWNSDDQISAYVHQNTSTDGFRGMGSRWNFARDLRLFRSDEEEDGTLWPDWDSFELRSNRKEDDFRYASNHCRFSPEKRSSKPEVQKPEEAILQVAKLEAEVNGQRHKFRLGFEQPFADLDEFQRKLHNNFLCLENIRVDDRSLRSCDEDFGGTGPSRTRQGTTILCSIKVRHTDGGPGTVFARCTDNDWTTYADLPAQHLAGVTNLGFDYDTFCFAVRKPVQPLKEEEEAEGAGPTSAVEFALCCRVTTEGGIISYWDNNGGANYRIEWFDN